MSSEGPAFPVSVSDLHFPSAAVSVSQLLSSLRRSALSVTNRLRSVEADARFVHEVADHYELPLIANERCGSWYIDPAQKAASAYFKSTDGHTGQWNFSLRRLNLQILSLARDHGGCIIVDSTRRGKLMPDALSKTIPIWCAVLNRTLFPTEPALHPVQFPPNFLTASEEAQIEKRIDGFVKALQELKLDLKQLTQDLGQPIQIAWANQSYFYPTALQKGEKYNLFVLCSASRRVHGAEASEGAPVFWENKDLLLATEESELPDVIKELMHSHGKADTGRQAALLRPSSNLYITQAFGASGEYGDYDLVISCNDKPPESGSSANRLDLGCGPHKIGSRDLRSALGKVIDFVEKHFNTDASQSLLVACETGKDLSVGTLLAIICRFYDDNGKFVDKQPQNHIDKQFIRQRLAWIITSKPDANPSRATLQSVNAFLLQRPD
ncbi:tRNA a64-2'-o-ribosylphosphate transferase [Talaromyces proteolyticus]|uniref:tRNA a64-2'-o-ribosylphosphate transferase n=1 Tax=Talaromyces proteolyticus TaxID=1131652 RepID=A0AAD4KZD7_9EURO|nr:tRNA a64-2'-o-ribosylphosphate transferase [Talaromyces proteolyticus]KAH8702347.1 tRNA a64-2'-o-ribosylphosphate transferase [Talaromyces proteolyticus]